MQRGFDTAKSKSNDISYREPSANLFKRYRPQILISVFIVVVLVGGAAYAARSTENTPKVVYSASLDEVAAEANQSLMVDINTADVEELDELPEVGPSTAEKIVEYRQANGSFRTVEELEEVSGIGPVTIEKIKPFAEVGY